MSRPTSVRPTRPTARSVAASVLTRVHRDNAFASAVLDTELERTAQLSPRDRRLATELVYGALRTQPYLQSRLEAFAPRGLGSLDLETRAHLLIAAYQLVCLDRIPSFAAVSEAVQLIQQRRNTQLGRFANAVLRKLADQVREQGHVTLTQALEAAAPSWLLKRLSASLGSTDQAFALLTAGPFPPPLGLRLSLGQDRETWRQHLIDVLPAAEVTLGKVSPLCLKVRGAGSPQSLPGFGSPAWIVQEEGSQALALAVGARPGERVLDACAGRGNKTSLLAQLVGPEGRVDACDLHPSKLEVLRQQVTQVGAQVGSVFPVDWSVGPGDVPEGYDRVLVDAPCSGVGTLRRRPELVIRDMQGALSGLSTLQTSILVEAAKRCRPGGRILYAVCSVLREEAEQVVAKACELCPGLHLAPFDAPAVQQLSEGQPCFRLLPHVHGTDGYFVASLQRSPTE